MWHATDHFRAPSPVKEWCWRREIAVPLKDPFAVVELGLWSMLSMVDVVKTLLRIFGGRPLALCEIVGRQCLPSELRAQ